MESQSLAKSKSKNKYCLFIIGSLDDPLLITEEEKNGIIRLLEQGKKFVIIQESLVMLNSIQSIRPLKINGREVV